MFTKAFRVKSNTVIKGSDRRKLRADISTAFPSLSADHLNELIPNREELNVVKIYAHKGDAVTLYVLHRNPVFFQLEKQLYPTGVVAPVAVGTAAVSSNEMRANGMKGKGVNVLHTYMDQLWAFGDKTSPPIIPVTDPLVQVEADMDGEKSDEEGTEDLSQQTEEQNDCGTAAVESFCQKVQDLRLREGQTEGETEEVQEEQEDLRSPQGRFLQVHLSYMSVFFLLECGLDLPRVYPKGKNLDIKKSSYKKLSKFLQSMQKEHNLVRVKDLSKGVDSIVEVEWRNPELCSFCVPEDWEPPEESESCEVVYKPPEITLLHGVTARLEPLFQDAQKKKGAVLQASEVRSIITDYVKRNELVHDTNKNTLSRMQSCHQLQFPGQAPVIRKGQVEPIDISVASRGSNKKVTIIKNLEVFGIEPTVVADTLQHLVQASSVLHDVPGAKERQLVQIQGNQVHHVGKLLLEKYQIPRKYIQGLDKASKTGKKK
ncbi:Eukaryotic translation initiation factor 2D [Bagarius yarrelli]|uniref:Eukaryotic translation initiation factor 2D n=1 Tax=Bagarius yarrelli TaxID=175774 RepID=A0A556U246_BAGYA|nr:Eukaryotic translation initiation factor 2D [Bagarius yarrelli]